MKHSHDVIHQRLSVSKYDYNRKICLFLTQFFNDKAYFHDEMCRRLSLCYDDTFIAPPDKLW